MTATKCNRMMMQYGAVLAMATACSREATAPAPDLKDGTADRLAVARTIVERGRDSTVDALALADPILAKQVAEARGAHAKHIAGAPPDARWAMTQTGAGPSALRDEQGPIEIELSSETFGKPLIYNVTTAISDAGDAAWNLVGMVSYRGHAVDMELWAKTTNQVGSRPPMPMTHKDGTRSNDPTAQAECLGRFGSHPWVCGLSSYSEMSWPGIPHRQPCGSSLNAHTQAVAYYDFTGLGTMLSQMFSMKFIIRIPVIGRTGDTDPVSSPEATRPNATCVAPEVKAEMGGVALVEPGHYRATIDEHETTVGAHLYSTLTNTPLPAGVVFTISLDGVDYPVEGTHSYAYLNEGRHVLNVTATDTLLGQTSSSSADIVVSPHGDPYNGGGDEGPPPSNCVWARDWAWVEGYGWWWLNSAYLLCDGDFAMGAIAGAGESIDGSAAHGPKAATPLHVRINASKHLDGGQRVSVERSKEPKLDAIINVDVSTASAADLEAAFRVAEGLADVTPPLEGRASIRSVVGRHSATLDEQSRSGSLTDRVFRQLLPALTPPVKSGALNKTVDVILERRNVTRRHQ